MSFVFIHPPRTGGTSIRKQIGYDICKVGNIKHAHYRYIANKFDIEAAYKFATVRNPYHRAVSLWGMWGENALPFGEWIQQLAKDWDHLDELSNMYIFAMDGKKYHHAAPLMFWIENIANFDKIVRFEHRAEDLMEVAAAIGRPIDSTVEAKSRSDRNSFDLYYSNETRALVRELYAEDFEKLGYQ